jgi:hypothetical protein
VAADRVVPRLRRLVKAEWDKCPDEHREQFLDGLRRQLRELTQEHATRQAEAVSHRDHTAPFIGLSTPLPAVDDISLELKNDMRRTG